MMDNQSSCPDAPKWSGWDVAIVLLILFLLIPLSALSKPILVSFIKTVAIKPSPSMVLFFSTAVQAVVMIAAVMLLIKRKGAGAKEVGLVLNNLSSRLFLGFWSGIFLCFAVIGIGFLITLITGPPPPQSVEKLLQGFKSGKEIFFPVVSISVLAPVSEELYFRGMAYPVLKKKFGVYPALLLSALFFGAMHMDLYRLVPIAIGGIGLAYLYEKTGSLVTSITAHSVWNTLMLLLLYAAAKNPING